MKDLAYYMTLPYKVEIIKDTDEEGFVALLPELKGCITTGLTQSEALENLEDAKKAWLTSALIAGDPVPEPCKREYSGEFKLRMPKSLHQALMQHSKDEGVSMNQYCLMLLSRYDAMRHFD